MKEIADLVSKIKDKEAKILAIRQENEIEIQKQVEKIEGENII